MNTNLKQINMSPLHWYPSGMVKANMDSIWIIFSQMLKRICGNVALINKLNCQTHKNGPKMNFSSEHEFQINLETLQNLVDARIISPNSTILDSMEQNCRIVIRWKIFESRSEDEEKEKRSKIGQMLLSLHGNHCGDFTKPIHDVQ